MPGVVGLGEALQGEATWGKPIQGTGELSFRSPFYLFGLVQSYPYLFAASIDFAMPSKAAGFLL